MRSLICLIFVALMSTTSGCGSSASEANTTAPVAKSSYKHHRILIWTVDKKSHTVKGFDEAIVGPSQEITLEPVADYTVSIRTGAIKDVTVTDFKTEWQEKHLTFRISYGTTRSEGTRDLENLFLSRLYGGKKYPSAILIGIPVSSSATKDYLQEIDRVGAASALEDLLLMATVATERPLGLGDLLDVYDLLGEPKRMDRWRQMIKKGTPTHQLIAAGVLMKFDDADGRRKFCNACLRAKGNSQVHLIDLLLNMPASDETMVTIVKLILAPTVYRTKELEGVGLAQVERRQELIATLKNDYSREALEPYAAELRTWAKSESGQKYGGEQIFELLDEK